MLKKIINLISKLKLKVKLFKMILNDNRSPRIIRWLLGLMVGYALFPFDFIADVFPFVGWVDDLLVIFSLIWLIVRLIPKRVISESESKIDQASNRRRL